MNLEEYKLPQLKSMLRALKLKTRGVKATLIARLNEVGEETLKKVINEMDDEGEVASSDENVDDVEGWKAEALSMRALIEQLSGELKALRQSAAEKDLEKSMNASFVTSAATSPATTSASVTSTTSAATTATSNYIGTTQRNMSAPVSSVVSLNTTVHAPATTQRILRNFNVTNATTTHHHMAEATRYVVTDDRTLAAPVLSHIPAQNFYATNSTHMPSSSRHTFMPMHYEQVQQRPSENASSTPMQIFGQQQTVKDIASILPDFDPANEAYNSSQFIDRIEQLNEVYGWNDAVLLFAVMGKLRGAAKQWVDAQPVFRTWREFVVAFINDFPSNQSAANTHILMMNTMMRKNEKVIDYYYRMLSLGRRDGIDDVSIIRYVINGLSDVRLKYTLSIMKFGTCSELLQSIINFSSNFANQTVSSNRSVDDTREDKLIDQNKPIAKYYGKMDENYRGPVCYNCKRRGHISRNCTQPRKGQKPNERVNQITAENTKANEESEEKEKFQKIQTHKSIRLQPENTKN